MFKKNVVLPERGRLVRRQSGANDAAFFANELLIEKATTTLRALCGRAVRAPATG